MTHQPHHHQPPVVGIPATTTTPAVELRAAKILAAMQRFEDLDWTSVRTIRSQRVRSTWATTDSVTEALGHLVRTGLVQQGSEVDARGATRPRYRLTEAGERAYIDPTRLAQEKKRPMATFHELFVAIQAACPPGMALCLVPIATAEVMAAETLPRPTEPSPF